MFGRFGKQKHLVGLQACSHGVVKCFNLWTTNHPPTHPHTRTHAATHTNIHARTHAHTHTSATDSTLCGRSLSPASWAEFVDACGSVMSKHLYYCNTRPHTQPPTHKTYLVCSRQTFFFFLRLLLRGCWCL